MDWTLPENLKKLKEMAEQTTLGPWRFRGVGMDRMLVGGEQGEVVQGVGAPIIVADPCVFNPQDESFVVAAREALPQLIAVAAAARRALDRYEEERAVREHEGFPRGECAWAMKQDLRDGFAALEKERT